MKRGFMQMRIKIRGAYLNFYSQGSSDWLAKILFHLQSVPLK